MSHSRDLTMLLNEISLRSGLTIRKYVALRFYCFNRHYRYIVKWNKICKKKYLSCVPNVDGKKAIPRASCSKAVTRRASSPPMLHYAFGMDFPIHTRNTLKILIFLHRKLMRKSLSHMQEMCCNIRIHFVLVS